MVNTSAVGETLNSGVCVVCSFCNFAVTPTAAREITHDYNYKELYKSLNKVEADSATLKAFVPTVASSMEIAIKSAIWYWKKENINTYADLDDIGKVSAAVNYPAKLKLKTFNTDGINGLDERKRFYSILKDVFNYENCK